MPFAEPFKLGPFTVNREGGLLPSDARHFPTFGVQFAGRHIRASLAGDGEVTEGGALMLQSVIGRLPSTAASGAEQREQVFELVRPLRKQLPAGWELELSADHRLGIRARYPLEMPTTATALVSVVTDFLLELGPYLELLAESGLGAPVGGVSAKA